MSFDLQHRIPIELLSGCKSRRKLHYILREDGRHSLEKLRDPAYPINEGLDLCEDLARVPRRQGRTGRC